MSNCKGIFFFNKCRVGRRSNESIELQSLTGAVKTPKGVLRRMPRVRSDEIQAETDDHQQHIEIKEKLPSPIGAGLPLLHRLRLLKEKQVSFELRECY